MSDKPIDPEEVSPQGEPYRQLNKEEIEENAVKLLNLVEEGSKDAYREFYVELKAKGYQSQQITEITVCTVKKIQRKTYSAVEKLRQRIEEFRSLNSRHWSVKGWEDESLSLSSVVLPFAQVDGRAPFSWPE